MGYPKSEFCPLNPRIYQHINPSTYLLTFRPQALDLQALLSTASCDTAA